VEARWELAGGGWRGGWGGERNKGTGEGVCGGGKVEKE